MIRHQIYTQYHWFHQQVRQGKYPNAATLASECELSPKTAQRAIDFMRDRLRAPLEYVAAKRGYRYDDDSFELPPDWVGPEEFASLLLSFRLSSLIPDKELKETLRELLEDLIRMNVGRQVRLSDIEAKVSLKNVEYARVPGEIFHQVFDALLAERSLRLDYRSPHRGKATSRDVFPLHLLCYMGNWHLIAYCSLRGELRDFSLARIRRVELAPGPVACPVSSGELKEHLRQSFGIMSGPKRHRVELRFAPEVADFVAEQVWHPDQQESRDEDGGIRLSFPVADFREIRREVFKFGAAVEVLAPAELRDDLRSEIEKMNAVYR